MGEGLIAIFAGEIEIVVIFKNYHVGPLNLDMAFMRVIVFCVQSLKKHL
jgi:hypothetical protein